MRFVFLLVFTAFVLGCVGSKQEYPVSGDPLMQECNTLEDIDSRFNCYSQIAYDNGRPGLCEDIASKDKRNMCVYRIAKKYRDPQMCQMIKGDDESYSDCIMSSTL